MKKKKILRFFQLSCLRYRKTFLKLNLLSCSFEDGTALLLIITYNNKKNIVDNKIHICTTIIIIFVGRMLNM